MKPNPKSRSRSGNVATPPIPALVLLAACGAWALAAWGCSYSNPHGEQDTPPITRITTIPAGATIVIEPMNLKMETPCDLPTELDEDDEIIVTKKGYLPWKGPLSDLPQIARGTYQLRLEQRPPGLE